MASPDQLPLQNEIEALVHHQARLNEAWTPEATLYRYLVDSRARFVEAIGSRDQVEQKASH